MAEVVLVKTDDRIKGMSEVFKHFNALLESFKGKHVVIKPNFNTADPPPGSTDIRMISELITHLKLLGARKITVAERSGPVNTRETMITKGLFDLQESIGGFDIVDFSELPESEWVHFIPDDSHWKDGFLVPKLIQEAEAVIALPCLKTHQFGGHFTLSLKLAVGIVPRQGYNYMKELHSSPHMRKLIAEINQAYTPDLVILDCVDAFINGGPANGELVHPNIILASTDRIAIDAVGVAILRQNGTTPEVSSGKIFDQEQIARAVELGLGVKKASEIVIKGVDGESSEHAEQLLDIIN